MSLTLATSFKTKYNCSWFEQTDASSAKIEINLWLSVFNELTTAINQLIQGNL